MGGGGGVLLYLGCLVLRLDAHGSQACLQLRHIHLPVIVGVQPGEQLLVRFRRISCAATVREQQLLHDCVHGSTGNNRQLSKPHGVCADAKQKNSSSSTAVKTVVCAFN